MSSAWPASVTPFPSSGMRMTACAFIAPASLRSNRRKLSPCGADVLKRDAEIVAKNFRSVPTRGNGSPTTSSGRSGWRRRPASCSAMAEPAMLGQRAVALLRAAAERRRRAGRQGRADRGGVARPRGRGQQSDRADRRTAPRAAAGAGRRALDRNPAAPGLSLCRPAGRRPATPRCRCGAPAVMPNQAVDRGPAVHQPQRRSDPGVFRRRHGRRHHHRAVAHQMAVRDRPQYDRRPTRPGRPTRKQIGRDLGVRYLLEGSIRACSDRLRITAQLVDAASGGHVWAERYDRTLQDVFALQDEIAARRRRRHRAESAARRSRARRRKRPDSLDAYDLVLRAQPDVDFGMPAQVTRALVLLEQALALDPSYALAHALCRDVSSLPVPAGGTARTRIGRRRCVTRTRRSCTARTTRWR